MRLGGVHWKRDWYVTLYAFSGGAKLAQGFEKAWCSFVLWQVVHIYRTGGLLI